MEEIIPFIEQSWRDMALSEGITVTTLVVEDTTLAELFKAAFSSSKIVVTAFNAQIALALVHLRSRYFVDTPFVFYLHGFASVACWPMKKWGLLDVWREQDIFISSAKRDLELFRLSIKTENSFVIPFALLDEVKPDETQQGAHDHLSLYYVGRISEQKNLHTLLWALSIYLKYSHNCSISLDIFGSEDNLGSPNMGQKSGSYLQVLEQLSRELALTEIVKFHGFINRNLIADKIHAGRKVLISTSLHADENFGMAALRALSMGHSALLSDWGGHSDYVENFKDAVTLVDVEVSKTGPFVVVDSLVKQIEKLANSSSSNGLMDVPNHYQLESIREKLKSVYLSNAEKKFEFSDNIEILAHRWDEFKDNPQSCRVFTSFEDVIFHQFSMAYAGRSRYYENSSMGELAIAPWVKIKNDQIVVSDPHRGERVVVLSSDLKRNRWLVENGYAFSRSSY
ncbi:MAG: glycosyltransferase family 4 protein [Bacteriovoracia bacterium]